MLYLYASREPFLKETDARARRNPPTPTFRRALALDADGICASVSWRAAIVAVLGELAIVVAVGVAFVADPL